MCEEVSPSYFEVLQTHLPRRPGDSQYNMRQNSHSPVQDMNPEPPIFEAAILPLRPHYILHTKQERFYSSLTLTITNVHVKRHRTFT